MNKTYEELGEELCKYCFCTEYGDNINLANPSAYSNGCEEMYCKEAYEYYLGNCEEGDKDFTNSSKRNTSPPVASPLLSDSFTGFKIEEIVNLNK